MSKKGTTVIKDFETGTTVIKNFRGVFDACQSRVGICGFACCQFGVLGNWIYALPGEIEEAKSKGLSFDHLTVEEMADGGARVNCNRPCVEGEFKSIDCAIYPIFIANDDGTQFIVADHRKCPIPNNEILEHAKKAQALCLEWERSHPGTLKGMANASKGFKAYQPFPWALELDGTVRKLSEDELKAITPNEVLADDYVAKFKGVDIKAYSGTETPEDGSLKEIKLRVRS